MTIHFWFVLNAVSLVIISQFGAFTLLKNAAIKYHFSYRSSLLLSSIGIGFFYALLLGIHNFSPFSQASYLLFGIAFLTTALTDAQTMLISRWSSIFLAPIALIAANFGFLQLTPLESLFGAFLGLITLSITARLAFKWTGQESLGQGDIDFLAFVGSVLGPIGCWKTLLIGSISGSIFGISFTLIKGQPTRTTKLPFGTFLALGAMIEILTQLHVISLFC